MTTNKKKIGTFTLIELRNDQCHWPLDSGLFCGAKVAHGPYCAKHARISYKPSTHRGGALTEYERRRPRRCRSI
jgi:hypothetical protein